MHKLSYGMVVGLGFKWSWGIADKSFVDSKIDLTFYYLVKEKFVAEPGTMVFIDARSENIDELVPQVFTRSTMAEFEKVMGYNWDNRKAYFALNNLGPYRASFMYICRQFYRREDLFTGELKEFRLDPFPEPVDMDQASADLKRLGNILRGNSEAS